MKHRLIFRPLAYVTACVLVLAICAMPFPAQSQFSVDYSRVYGGSGDDEGASIDVDDAHGMIVVGGRSFSSDGYLNHNEGGSDFWLMQMTSDGDTLWSHSYGGFDNDDLHVIRYFGDQTITAFGTTWSDSTGDVPGHTGQVGAWLMSTDLAGNLVLSTVYSGTFGEQGIDFAPMSNGYTLLVQASSPVLDGQMSHGNFDFWVARVSEFGNIMWSKFYGGMESDVPARILKITGGFIVIGSTTSVDGDIPENAGGYDYWILRLGLEGELIWSKTFGGTGDDLARDGVILNDGTILITGQSNSLDGDRSMAYGGDDVWVINIDMDGNLLSERSYGGTDDDQGRRIIQAGNQHLAMLSQSESDDEFLTGNKGLMDVWLAYLDTDGSIVQQMNYGGSLEDYGQALAVGADSTVYMVGSSESTDGNLPYPGYPMDDLWLMRMSVDTVPCASNNECFPYDLVNFAVLRPETNGPIVCVAGCNAGAEQGPTGPPGCTNFQGAGAWFKVKTDATAEVLSVQVTSPEFNVPQILVMQGGWNCTNFTALNCDIGEDGESTIVNMPVDPDTAYWVIIGEANGMEGSFNLCVSLEDINFCNRNPQLYVTQTSMGSPLAGPFQPGEDVQFCYEVTLWDKIECNGLQGIVPSFGPGWDSLSFNSMGMPVQIDTMLSPVAPNGEWNWWPLGSVHYNFTNPIFGYSGGQTLPTGWYFVNDDDPPPNDNPDQSIGDLIGCVNDDSRWKVCFTIQTKEDCSENLDCFVSVKSFADGEIGANVSQACQNDPPLKINRFLNCCIDPMMVPVPDITICSGDSIIVTLESNINPPVTYTWGVNVSGSIIGAAPGVSSNVIFQDLTNLGNTPGTVTYTVKGASTLCETPFETFVVTVLPQPSGNMTLAGPSTVCREDGVQVRFDFIGNGPFIAEYAINGVVQPPILSETQSTTITVPVTEDAMIAFTGFVDGTCPGDPNGAFFVSVLQPGETTLDLSICQGDSVHVGGHVVGFPGMYVFTLDNASENGCDSIITLNLEVNRTYERNLSMAICEGQVFMVGPNAYGETGFYRDTLSSINGCDSIINLSLTVSNEIVDEQSAVICAGTSIEFGGQTLFQDGTYYDTIPIGGDCDSIKILHLNVLNVIVLIQTVIEPDTGQNSGSILIQVAGGIPPYTYLWSTGDTTNNPTNLASGNYQLTVTDLLGCTAEFNFFLVSSTEDLLPGVETFMVYPNPVQEGHETQVLIKRDAPRNTWVQVDVFNAQGIRCTQENVLLTGAEDHLHITNAHLPEGVYFLRITDTKSGRYMVRRYLIQ